MGRGEITNKSCLKNNCITFLCTQITKTKAEVKKLINKYIKKVIKWKKNTKPLTKKYLFLKNIKIYTFLNYK